MSESSKAIDQFLSTYVTPELKKHGFKKLRRKYRRTFEDRLESLSLEAHTFSHSERASFDISASIYIPEVARALGREADGIANVGGYECGLYHSVRQIMPESNRFLGAVTHNEAENRAQGEWLIAGLNEGVIPWFERLRDPIRLLEYLRARSDFEPAAWTAWFKKNGMEL